MTDKNTPIVAFIGLGSMGLGMARNLLKHGHKVIGVDPSAGARDAFTAAGGTTAATPAEAAATADVVVVAVVNAQQVDTVLFGDGGAISKLRKDGLVMQCATVPPAFAKALGERLAKTGHVLLDAPMSGARAPNRASSPSCPPAARPLTPPPNRSWLPRPPRYFAWATRRASAPWSRP
jgi:putative dehydrogenase